MYGDFMMMVDDEIGRVLKALKEGMKDHALVIFTSDNGPVWYDQDVGAGHDSAADCDEIGCLGRRHRIPFIAR